MPFTLNVNGKSVTVDVPADMPLLWVLRDVLDLRATKFGCGLGQCGACTVHLRGNAVRSCQTPVSGRRGRDHHARRTLDRRLASAAARVGGARRAAVRLLPGRTDHVRRGAAAPQRRVRPTRTSILAMSGNLCRCATYTRIREAIHRAARQSRAATGDRRRR